jgi:excisionase family DNA binding protein
VANERWKNARRKCAGDEEASRISGSTFPGIERRIERMLDSYEAAAILRIHPKTLQRMARSGEIRGVQVGKLWRFRSSDIEWWIGTKLAS